MNRLTRARACLAAILTLLTTASAQAAAPNWVKVADKTAPTVAEKAPVDEDVVRAAIGGLFFVLSLIYVVSTVKRLLLS